MDQIGATKGNEIMEGLHITDTEVENHLNKRSCLDRKLNMDINLTILDDPDQAWYNKLELGYIKNNVVGRFCFCNYTDLCNKHSPPFTSDAGSGNRLMVSTLVMTVLMLSLIHI